MSCVGDYSCPGTKKCCPAYPVVVKDTKTIPVLGYCREPADAKDAEVSV